MIRMRPLIRLGVCFVMLIMGLVYVATIWKSQQFSGNENLSIIHHHAETSDGATLGRPYYLSDLKYFTKDDKLSYSAHLNEWGNVMLVVGTERYTKSSGSEVMFPAIYLTNHEGYILYDFSIPFQTATKIIETSITDLDGDGLKDLTIITGFSDYDTGEINPDMPQITRTFFQLDNGLFDDGRQETVCES